MIKLIEEGKAFSKAIYDNHSEQPLFYHNWSHTEMALRSATEILENMSDISEKDKINVQLAMIFHDVGFTEGRDGHEKRSANIAREFLSKHNVLPEDVSQIESLILATQMGYIPVNNLEKVVQDADLSHLANADYITSTYEGLCDEINATREDPFTPKQWAEVCVGFMKAHQYHTDFARDNYDPGKQQNLRNIKMKLEEEETKKKKKGKKNKPVKDPNKPERGVETMFRVALRNHLSLSQIADNKANTLISVNGIIISIVISALFPKMDTNPFLVYPGIVLIGFSIITIILAILSTIPKTTHGVVSKQEVADKKGNLLFFGNFHKMSINEFEWALGELMKDKDYLYKSLTRDLYYLGKVLNKKYTLLRYSYGFFVAGLVIAIAFFFSSMRNLGG